MLNPTKLGLAGGILWSVFIFVMTWLAYFTGYASFFLTMWMDVYPGYEISPTGSLIGLVYAFLYGFIVLALLAWLYNKLIGS